MIPVLVRKEMLTAAKVIARRNCSLNRGDSDRYTAPLFWGQRPEKHTEKNAKIIKVNHFVYHFGRLLYTVCHILLL